MTKRLLAVEFTHTYNHHQRFRPHASGGDEMNYNVSQLLKEPIGSERLFTIDKGDISESGQPVDNATGAVRLVRTHQGIWAQAQLAAWVSQDCSRCLADFSQTLFLEIDDEYFPEVDVRTGRRVASPEDWEGLYIGADHILDLGEATRQAALAILPLKPLCKPECVGICDRCGVDRNQTECECYAVNVDPRWAALRSLIVDQPN